jgi:uncharacterized protein YunC (DUF1805 family)
MLPNDAIAVSVDRKRLRINVVAVEHGYASTGALNVRDESYKG